MRLVNVKQIFVPSLFALATLHTASARPGADVGTQTNLEVKEDSGVFPDTFEVTPRASFLNPTSVLASIQDAYLPPALRVAGVLQAFVEPVPSSPDFWEVAKESEKNLRQYVHSLLEAAGKYFQSTYFTNVTSAMNNIVNATTTFRDNIQGALDAHNITLETLTLDLEHIFMEIVHDIEKIPPPDKAPNHAERAAKVDKVLDDTMRALTQLATRYGIEEDVVITYILALKPHIQLLTVTIGDINEQHPQLFPALAFSVAVLLMPEIWILRPFLSVFGFGPSGPIKGSAAAWVQRYFWGAAVRAGSWFSWLQAAGMGVLPRWAGLVTKVPLLVGSILAMLLPCLYRE